MRQRPKQLPDAVASPAGAAVAGGAMGDGNSTRFAGAGELRELPILLQARQYAHAGIGNYKLEASVRGGVGDEPALRPTAMLVDVFLQLAQSTHQAADKSARQPRRY